MAPMAPSLVVDPVSDRNLEEFVRLGRRHELPEFVKSAELDSLHPAADLPDSLFGDGAQRRYPLHTPAATWISAMYFGEKQGAYHAKDAERVRQRILAAADYHRVRPQVDDILSKAAADVVEQLPDSAYAYVYADSDGRVSRYMPLTSSPQVKDAAEWLDRYRDRLPYRDRRVVASKILDRAQATGTKLAEDAVERLERQAGRGVCRPEDVVEALRIRAGLAKSAEFRTAIERLAAGIVSRPAQSLHPRQLVKLAETIDDIDRGLQLPVSAYGQRLRRAEDVVFSATHSKTAAAYDSAVELVTGRVYDRGDLRKLGWDDLEATFGTELASQVGGVDGVDVEKLAELAATLPLPDAELLEELLADRGVSPALGTKSAGERLPPTLVAELADRY